MNKLPTQINQRGTIPVLLLIAIVATIIFLSFIFYAPFKDQLFTSLYPKPASLAAQDKSPKFEDGIVLVKFKDSITEAEEVEILKTHEATKKEEIKQIKVKALKVPAGKVLEKIEKLKNHPKVEFAEVNGIGEADFIPNDPTYTSQWHLQKIAAPAAWDSSQGTGFTIAIADTGVNANHPDLQANIVPGWNVYDNNADTSDIQGHGTAVAGVAGAVLNNNTMIAGIAGKGKIMPIRIAFKDASGKAYAYWYDMAEAITYAADRNVKVINVSYEGSTGNRTVRSAADYMVSKGGLTVFAEGNSMSDSGFLSYPSIINVSATTNTDTLASFSTFGNDVDVSAPGQGIVTTDMNGSVNSWNGTSFSSPLTAGVLALIWQTNPALTPTQVSDILGKSADDLGTPGWDIYFGWGRINAAKAVALASGQPQPSISPTTIPSSTPTATPPNSADTLAPVVSITSPANGARIKRNTNFTISANASDNIAVSKVEFYLNNDLKCTDITASYSCTTKLGGKPNSSNTIIVKAYDTSSNISSSSIQITAN